MDLKTLTCTLTFIHTHALPAQQHRTDAICDGTSRIFS